jgi:hypothetical protein
MSRERRAEASCIYPAKGKDFYLRFKAMNAIKLAACCFLFCFVF